MKRLIFLLCSCVGIAQNTDFKNATAAPQAFHATVSGLVDVSQPSHLGVFIELHRKDGILKDYHRARIFQVSATQLKYTLPGVSLMGKGFELGYGTRQYWEKTKTYGLYTENLLTYGQVEVVDRSLDFSGTYAYWSLLNTRLGYKHYWCANGSIEPYVGVMWKWEVRGRGDVDNIYVDNWVWSAGVKLGYSFN